jgi:hypothetical protein
MQVMKLSMMSIPVWIKLLHLLLEFWSSICLSHVASGIGKPLYVDSFIEEQQRLDFARLLMVINVKSKCPWENVIARKNGSMITIVVEYLWFLPSS